LVYQHNRATHRLEPDIDSEHRRPTAQFRIERLDGETGEVLYILESANNQASWHSPRGELYGYWRGERWPLHRPFWTDQEHMEAMTIDFYVGDILRFTDLSEGTGGTHRWHNLQMEPQGTALASAINALGWGPNVQSGWPTASFEVEITEDMILRHDDGRLRRDERNRGNLSWDDFYEGNTNEDLYNLRPIYGQRLFYAVADRLTYVLNPIAMQTGRLTDFPGGVGPLYNWSQNGNHLALGDDRHGAMFPGNPLYHFQADRIRINPEPQDEFWRIIIIREVDEDGNTVREELYEEPRRLPVDQVHIFEDDRL